jgi:hypothetical protein
MSKDALGFAVGIGVGVLDPNQQLHVNLLP